MNRASLPNTVSLQYFSSYSGKRVTVQRTFLNDLLLEVTLLPSKNFFLLLPENACKMNENFAVSQKKAIQAVIVMCLWDLCVAFMKNILTLF